MQIPFSPAYTQTQTISATSPAASVSVDANANQIRILNTGANIAFVRCYNSVRGTVTVAATTTDFPVAPGQAATITKDLQHDKISTYSASGTTLYITPGRGL